MHVEDAQEALSFSRVAVGGTFDRLHAGHRMLLAATALVCTRSIYIGITGGWAQASALRGCGSPCLPMQA